jgi:L-alanine-DL-glutamate epimerase-like enolase superfamily enzyme
MLRLREVPLRSILTCLPVTTHSSAVASLIRYPLEKPVGGSAVSSVDVVVVDLVDSDGVAGLGFTYVIGGSGAIVLAAAREQIAQHVLGRPSLPPQALWRTIAAGFGRTGLGPNLLALAAIDVAAWDVESRRRALPLGVAMGGTPRPVAVYGSGGFTATQSPADAAGIAAAHAAAGLGAVKPRVRGARSDEMLLSAVRDAVPPHVHVMADANEKCDLPSAVWLVAAAKERGVLFVEEPLPAGQLEGYRTLARSGGASVAAGEHLQGPAFHPFITEHLLAVVQPDLAMAGGLTPALDVSRLCEMAGVSVSPHFLPGLFVHVAAASPAIAWLEQFPLLEPLFDGWPQLSPDGTMSPRDVAGHGLTMPRDIRRRLAS